MLFHPLSHRHISRPAASASWLLRLMAFVLGGLLLWACACSATHDSDGHSHGWTPVSPGHLPLAAEVVEREMPHGPHPHPGAARAPYAVRQVLPQAKQLLTDAAALAVFAGVSAGVTGSVAVRLQAARTEGGRSRIRRSGRSTLAVVCRWRI
jgi:hypothetical protein